MLCAKALLYWCAAFRLTFDARRVYRDKFFVGYYIYIIVANKNLYVFIQKQNESTGAHMRQGIDSLEEGRRNLSFIDNPRAGYIETKSICVYTEANFLLATIYIL